MTHTIPLAARWMLMASMTLGGVALYRAEVHAQTVARARILAPAEPAEPAAPSPSVRAPVPARPAPAIAPESLHVRRLVVGTGVVSREPVGAAASFTLAQTAPLYAFVEIDNPGASEAVRVRFVRTGLRADPGVGRVTLAVPTAGRYRTWATTRLIRSPGAWAAVVETPEGHELARTPFTVR